MRIKIFLIVFIMACFFMHGVCAAESAYIEHFTKIHKADGYLFKISYQTKDEWTDGIVFKLFCTFNKGGELSFTSAGYNNLKKGWHDTEIFIPKVYRERYGYIEDYRVEMYRKGILVSIKSM